jgi:hypothetical protein
MKALEPDIADLIKKCKSLTDKWNHAKMKILKTEVYEKQMQAYQAN